MARNKRRGRNKKRRERRKAKREADNKVMRAIMKTCDNLGLYSELKLMIDSMMRAVKDPDGWTHYVK